ncbi:MAG: heavy metal translocating P-type ATPase [Roseiarcus sp.]
MTAGVDLSSFVRHHDDGTARLDLAVDGVTCAACIGDIEGALARLPGLLRARLNYTTRRLTVEWAEGTLDPARVLERLSGIGYRAYPFAADVAEDAEAAQARWLLRCLAVAGFAAMNVMLLSVSVWAGNASDITPETRDFFHWLSALIVLPAAAFAGQPFFLSALRGLRAGSLNMDMPISIGVGLALTMSVIETLNHAEHAYFDSAITLMFFLLIGRYCDLAMRRKTRSVAANLAALRAPMATRIEETGEATAIPASALSPGDTVLIRPGERAPCDGLVLSGRSEIDESLITGETMRRVATAGAAIYAGTLNFNGALRVRARAAAGATLIDEIERLIEGAVARKARYQRLADRAARFYAPVVHIAALATAVGWLIGGASLHDAVIAAIAVLIITCPCALALAIPAVQVVASGALFRSGVLLNAGDAIERLAGVDAVAFDKTGTLTLPDASVVNAAAVDPALLHRAARLAMTSHHPLAKAVAAHGPAGEPFDDADETPGEGVRATIEGVEARLGSAAFCGLEAEAAAARASDPLASVIAFRHGAARAIFQVRQILRADAAATIEALRRRGLKVMILSGDRVEAVAAAARALGVADWRADMKPAEKIAFLDQLKAQGRKILMIGDGLNDAPALAAAYASMSPATGANIAQASADAVFLGDRLAPVSEAIGTARAAQAIMRQNLTIAILYNLVAVPLAITGHVTPLIAALAMSGSSILVTLNALRARSPRRVEGATA